MNPPETTLLISTVALIGIYAILARTVPRNRKHSFIERLRLYYSATDVSTVTEFLVALFSLISVALYVIETYDDNYPHQYPTWALCTEAAFNTFFTFNYVLELVMARNRISHFFSLLAVVDVVTIVPVMVAILGKGYEASPTRFVRLFRVLMIARCFKPFRLLRVAKATSPGDDAVSSQTSRLAAFVIATLFMATGLVHALAIGEEEAWGGSSSFQFHDSLYFIVVTFSTVGFGDISPPTTASRMVVLLLIGFFFFVVPRELNRLNQLLDMGSKYQGSMPKHLTGGHIIVVCDSSSRTLAEAFLAEFFHEDHGYNMNHLVMLVPDEPDMDWKGLLLMYSGNERVTYLKGDPRSSADLARCAADSARAMFILSNRYTVDAREAEKTAFLAALTARDFNIDLPIYAQALTVASAEQLNKVGIPYSRLVCPSDIKAKMLATSVMWEGTSTFISNLLLSTSLDESLELDEWEKEYAAGMGKEVYVCDLGAYEGQSFSTVACELYERNGVLLMGISGGEGGQPQLHPGRGYEIEAGDRGFMMADDIEVVESILESNAMCGIGCISDGAIATNDKGRKSSGYLGKTISVTADGVEERDELDTDNMGSDLDDRASPDESLAPGLLTEKYAHVVIVSQELKGIASMLKVMNAPQAVPRKVVIICPMHSWNTAEDAVAKAKLDKMSHVRIIQGKVGAATLEQAKTSDASTLVIKSSRHKPSTASDEADAESISQLLEVLAFAGSSKKVLVELNGTTYGSQYEILNANVRQVAGGNGAGGVKKLADLQSVGSSGSLSEAKRMARTIGFRAVTDKGWSLSPGFASGSVILSNFAEIMLCQSFYNPEIIGIVSALLGSSSEGMRRESMEARQQRRSSSLDSSAFLAQGRPPAAFMVRNNDATFGGLVTYMMAEWDCLPLALVRRKRFNSGMTVPSYVSTCPNATDCVNRTDKVFMLIPDLPTWARLQREPGVAISKPLKAHGASMEEVSVTVSEQGNEGMAPAKTDDMAKILLELQKLSSKVEELGSRMNGIEAAGE